jgi:hypothetical protein
MNNDKGKNTPDSEHLTAKSVAQIGKVKEHTTQENRPT